MDERIEIFEGYRLFRGDRRDFREALAELMNSKKGKRFLLYANPHVSNLAVKDAGLKENLVSATFVLPDGNGLVWAARRAGVDVRERLPLSDLIEDLARVCAEKKRPLYLWGGEEGIARVAGLALRTRHPGLELAGESHGFLSEQKEKELLKKLQKHPEWVVAVGQGSPRQERLCRLISDGSNSPLSIALGNAPAFAAGLDKRAPGLVQALKLEWAWRLLLEPKKMWRRYLLGNFQFVLRQILNAGGSRG